MPTPLVLLLDTTRDDPVVVDSSLDTLLPGAPCVEVPWDDRARDWEGGAFAAALTAIGTHGDILILLGPRVDLPRVRSLLAPALVPVRRVALLANEARRTLILSLGLRYAACLRGILPLTADGLRAGVAALQRRPVALPHAVPPEGLPGYGTWGVQPLPWAWAPRSDRNPVHTIRFGYWRPGDPPPEAAPRDVLTALLEYLPDAAMHAGGARVVAEQLTTLTAEHSPYLQALLTLPRAAHRAHLLAPPEIFDFDGFNDRMLLLSLLARRHVLAPALSPAWHHVLDSLHAVLPTWRAGLAANGTDGTEAYWLARRWHAGGERRLPGQALEPIDPSAHAVALRGLYCAYTFDGMLTALRDALEGRDGAKLPAWYALASFLRVGPRNDEEWEALDQLARHRRMTKTRLRGLLSASMHWLVVPPELLVWAARYQQLGGGLEVDLSVLLVRLPATVHSRALLTEHRACFPDYASLIDVTLDALPGAPPAPEATPPSVPGSRSMA